jgi:hypothetical protein
VEYSGIRVSVFFARDYNYYSIVEAVLVPIVLSDLGGITIFLVFWFITHVMKRGIGLVSTVGFIAQPEVTPIQKA